MQKIAIAVDAVEWVRVIDGKDHYTCASRGIKGPRTDGFERSFTVSDAVKLDRGIRSAKRGWVKPTMLGVTPTNKKNNAHLGQ